MKKLRLFIVLAIFLEFLSRILKIGNPWVALIVLPLLGYGIYLSYKNNPARLEAKPLTRSFSLPGIVLISMGVVFFLAFVIVYMILAIRNLNLDEYTNIIGGLLFLSVVCLPLGILFFSKR